MAAADLLMTGVSLYSAVDLIEILVLLLDVYSAQAFMTSDVISSGALLRSVSKLFKLGRLNFTPKAARKSRQFWHLN